MTSGINAKGRFGKQTLYRTPAIAVHAVGPNRSPKRKFRHWLDSCQRDRDLRNVGGSGGLGRDRLAVGLGRHRQIRCESDAVDLAANSRAGDRPGDVADRICPGMLRLGTSSKQPTERIAANNPVA